MIQKILDKEAEVKKLSEKNKELENQKSILEMQLSETNTDSLQEKVDSLKHEVSLLQNDTKVAAKELENTRKELEMLNEEKNELEDRLALKQDEIVNLKERHHSATIELKRSMKEKFEHEKSQFEAKMTQYDQKMSKMAEEAKELEDFKRRDIKNKAIIEELQKDVTQGESKEKELADKISQLKDELFNLKQKGVNSQSKEEKQYSSREKASSRKDDKTLSDMKVKYETKLLELEFKEETIQSLKEDILKLEVKVKDKKEEIEKLLEYKDSFELGKNKLALLEEKHKFEIEKIELKLSNSDHFKAKLTEEIAELKESLKEEKEDKESLQKELKEQKQCVKKKNELNARLAEDKKKLLEQLKETKESLKTAEQKAKEAKPQKVIKRDDKAVEQLKHEILERDKQIQALMEAQEKMVFPQQEELEFYKSSYEEQKNRINEEHMFLSQCVYKLSLKLMSLKNELSSLVNGN